MKHSFTDEQLLNLVNNTITTKTEYQVKDFTGGSVQITSTNNHQLVKYKVTLFFGYTETRNSISKTIDISEGMVNIWMEALLLKTKSLQASNNGMDYSELNALMNNLTDKVEVVSNKVESTEVVSISSKSLSYELRTNIEQIISYLNEKTGANYKTTTKSTISHIKARLKEGFTLDDFYTVIDKKVLLWGKDIKMQAFLRPETLFGTKFESYLNEVVSQGKILQAQGVLSEAGAKTMSVAQEWANDYK